ncbi:NitT/TauT family transport system substrate-binding protein [Lachnospiraceae bacterium XBB2008]|nr:NitT/TauT family transport system substrate-binding protein [Lachnospiraceae bacterium XBB2008]
MKYSKSKSILSMLIIILMMAAMTSCGKASSADTQSSSAPMDATLNLAYQYGLSYAPAVIAQQQQYIEQIYHEKTGGTLTINWSQMSSGADINTAIASGELDGGFMGAAPAITGVTKGLGYKIFTNLSGQEHGLMTNDSSITSIGDLIGSDKQIALVNTGSIQHILLAKALYDNGYDAHALDSNIVAMKHPDGKTALESGAVSCHLTSSPYIFVEKTNPDLHELTEVSDSYTAANTFIVGIASEELVNTNPEVYSALCEGIQQGMDLINSDVRTAAGITAELDGNDPEVEEEYLQKGVYTAETSRLFELATFMYENGFLDNDPLSYENLVFPNVSGN